MQKSSVVKKTRSTSKTVINLNSYQFLRQYISLHKIISSLLALYLSLVFCDEYMNTQPRLEKPEAAPVSRLQRHQSVSYMEILSGSLLSLLHTEKIVKINIIKRSVHNQISPIISEELHKLQLELL